MPTGNKHSNSHISLFTGAGGLDIGLERSGFETILCVENNVDCSATLEANRGRFRNPEFGLMGDITKLSPRKVLKYSGLSVGEVDLISGGPPCQSFSTAGKRQSINDDRGTLIDYFLKTVDCAKPRFFVMENVRGLRSAALRHRPLNQRGNGYRPLQDNEQLGSLLRLRVLPALNAIGYQLALGTLNALDYGAAQDRERLIFVGSRDHEYASGDKSISESPSTEVGKRIKLLRKNSGISLVQLALLSGVSKTTLVNIEKGRTDPKAQTVDKIVAVLT